SPYLLNISINSTEDLSFANHNESPIEGNWIKLNGGTPVTLPALNLVFNGVNSSNFTRSGKTINITASVDNYSDYMIEYPYSSHSIYTNVSGNNEVNLSFFGSSHFADCNIDIYLVSSTPDEVWDMFNDVIDGNTTLIRNLINDSEKKLNYSLNSTGDNSSIRFGPQQAGNYVIFVLLNSSHTNTNEYSILSATAVQVLKYESVVTAPSKAKTNHFFNVKIKLTDVKEGNYTFGAIMIHKDAYEARLRFEFNGTRDQTNLTIDGADIVEKGELTGINLNSLNTKKLQEIIETVIGPENGTVSFTDETDSTRAFFSLTTNDLNTGDYYLLVGAYESGEGLVAFNQDIINIYPSPPSPHSSSGGVGHSDEPGNVEKTVNLRKYLKAGDSSTYNFNNVVTSVEVTPDKTYGLVAAKIEVLHGQPASITTEPPAGEIYNYVNVFVGTSGWSEGKLSSSVINFQVPASWFKENNIDPASVILYRHHNGNWHPLKTTMSGQAGRYYQYSSPTPGLSTFMILGSVGDSGDVEPVATPDLGTVAGSTPTPEATWISDKGIPGFGLLLGIMGVLIAVYSRRK
ncbi:MAG: TIGR04279 domain-containing protein, partial [ANME-2 cluster archaeon]|nr:TIGR04279 domain-containing protein [ANME-2 cluster archaeon]